MARGKKQKKIASRAKIPNDDNMIILGELTWDDISEIIQSKERGEFRASSAFWHNLGNEVEFRRQVGHRERKQIRKVLI